MLEEDDFDAYILNRLSDIIHLLLVTYTDSYLICFDTLIPYFYGLIQLIRSISDHQWALCVFDDIIQFTGAHSHCYAYFFLSCMTENLVDSLPETRQATAYGFDVMGMNDGQVYARACAEVFPRLFAMIGTSDSRVPENNTATENTISAVTKIFKYNNLCVDNLIKFHQVWFFWLPAHENTEEIPYVYGYLYDLIESNNPVIIGPNNSNVPNVIKLFANAFAELSNELNSVVGQRMVFILRHVQIIPSIFQIYMNALTDEKR
ncbi:unnamed protein product [Rotaria sp. Silwood2]|nr:unnamed protein product [Rotaria sp. Silwood2]CAF3061581.1 unnamed protein product [Rotaria sp. Silwood2]CAF3315646.1 unnamed protein product [Rotaria sp. Silwood2]CAF4288804.1 unnamed protein product [Rotaria sp. Silwood2]CAF4329468.1 unnamed protein product [Rotaria sp. Silwood2]